MVAPMFAGQLASKAKSNPIVPIAIIGTVAVGGFFLFKKLNPFNLVKGAVGGVFDIGKSAVSKVGDAGKSVFNFGKKGASAVAGGVFDVGKSGTKAASKAVKSAGKSAKKAAKKAKKKAKKLAKKLKFW